MPEANEPAQLTDLLPSEIPRLAPLYDRFAHALDPFDKGRDIAEQTFNSELRLLFDTIQSSGFRGIQFRDFRRHLITLCKQHLRAGDKRSGV
jgi:hypothetical protein